MEILNVENLIFKYPKCDTPVIDDVSFSIDEGEFVVLCGPTGSGKSTLLRNLKPEITPLGERTGNINISSRVGYVCQNPKQQAVTDKVWHELAFGLENMNMPVDEMRIRVAEMASYFGIESWFDKRVDELSGGQQQMLNLASVMVMNPDVLILDEPSSQLDPVAASEFFTTLKKLNDDFSLTIIIAEHRLEELIPCCNRLMVLKGGKLILNGSPEEVLNRIGSEEEIFDALPSAYRLFKSLSDNIARKFTQSGKTPVTIREGRELLRGICRPKSDYDNRSAGDPGEKKEKLPALEFKDVSFRFSKEAPDALKDMSFTIYTGEIFCFLGGNGSGKTTALNVAAGLLKPYEGTVRVFGKKLKEYKDQSLYNKNLSMLPQDVQTIFLHNTVREELESRNAMKSLEFIPFDGEALFEKHPYDLSGGEQQLLALAIVLATDPKIILLDEPTKGLDAYRKKKLAEILKKLKETGITIVMVTHDAAFAAECADRCALLFRGSMTSIGPTTKFLYGNTFYTTPVCRMSRGIIEGAVTIEGLKAIIESNTEQNGTK